MSVGLGFFPEGVTPIKIKLRRGVFLAMLGLAVMPKKMPAYLKDIPI